eukprot:SAG22_NODE_706_length_7763_cov_4.404228_5_plen_132_part_00
MPFRCPHRIWTDGPLLPSTACRFSAYGDKRVEQGTANRDKLFGLGIGMLYSDKSVYMAKKSVHTQEISVQISGQNQRAFLWGDSAGDDEKIEDIKRRGQQAEAELGELGERCANAYRSLCLPFLCRCHCPH